MNQYSELLYKLKGIAESNDLVNTVTKTPLDQLDLAKANIYPMVNIIIDQVDFTNGSVLKFNVSLLALSDRDLSPEIVTNKFWRQDNEVDNHNEMLAVLNDMWLRLKRDWDETNITASENPQLEKIEFDFGNILDGWGLSFVVEMPNTVINICN